MTYAPAWLAAVALVACTPSSRSHPDPPSDSFTAATFILKVGDTTESVSGARIRPEFFRTAQVRPLVGRTFIEEEYRSAPMPVVVLSHDYWQARFNRAPEIIGRPVELDGRPAVIVGVMEPGFTVPAGAKLWVPDTGKSLPE